MNCPVCNSKATGKVGIEQFYCWDCCVEFSNHNNEVSIYEVAEDGTLMVYGVHEEI